MRAIQSVLSTVAALSLTLPAFGQGAAAPGVIWHDRGDASALDLVGGPGGSAHEPGVDFTFIEESLGGTSPKFEVEDEHGVIWKVKLGEEARAESAATRLIWAAGYTVDETYYRPRIRVRGLERLVRGRTFVSGGDTVAGARLERGGGAEATGPWSWYDNPFVGTREFNGLRVMMALVNNWDLKALNNGGADPTGGGGEYGITDLGATFGRTGNTLRRSKGVPKDYAGAPFIEKVTRTHVDFRIRSRPFPLSVFNLGYYRARTRMQSVAKGIPIADARWIGDWLGRLSAEQIADAFRASGFAPDEVDAYTRVVMQRIAALQALTVSTADADGAGRRTPPPAADAPQCPESTCRQAPVRERLTAIPIGTPYARAVVGGFEQGAGFSGGLQVTSAHALPGVELRATALTSVQLFSRLDLEVLVPSIRGSRNHADIWFTHLQRDTDFFGIGAHTSIDLRTQFAIARRSVQASLSRDLARQVQGGVYAQLMDAGASRGPDTTETPIDERFSGSTAATPGRWLPGLLSDTRVLKYGAFVAYDSRDNSRGLTRGVNLYGRIASANGVGHPEGGTDYGWVEGDIDLRGYVPVGSHKTSLLLRSRWQAKAPREGRQIAFYDLSWLGGREHLRGYHSYRYRGNNAVLLSTEVQRTVRALTDTRGADVFAFADTGQVWGDARSSTDVAILDSASLRRGNWHSGFGGGLQYRHSRSVAARLEVGRSREATVTYVSMTRGF